VERTSDRRPEPHETWAAKGVWWHAVCEERVIAIADWHAGEHLHHAFHAPSPGLRMGADLIDVSDELRVLMLVGPRAPKLLAAAGLAGVPDPGKSVDVELAGGEVLIIHEMGLAFLIVMPIDNALALWTLLRDEGRPMGVGFVGAQTLARLGVSDRARARRAP